MTRNEMIKSAFNTICKAVQTDDYDIALLAEKLVRKWNDEHPEEREIFFAEDPDYFMIEDDVVYRTERN